MTRPSPAAEEIEQDDPLYRERDILFRIRFVTALLISGDGPLLRKPLPKYARWPGSKRRQFGIGIRWCI
ncbi:MAG TPA: hypothetical protein VII48_13755 [Rhizomicrobium sp.]